MATARTDPTRREFIKGVGAATVSLAVGMPESTRSETTQAGTSRVILVRHRDAVSDSGDISGELVGRMLEDAMAALFGGDDPPACWRQIIRADDVVGIKTNGWRNLPTPPAVEQAIRRGVLSAGVPERNIAIADRDVLENEVFQRSTALVNTRPMRSHAWSGVGSLIKNYITFVTNRPDYHPDGCAELARLWDLPIVRGKTRLNVLVMLTPQYHNIGQSHFDPSFVWNYNGLIVSTDPVAADSVGLRIIQQKRRLAFGEDRPLQPTAHHIAIADTQFHLGNSDPARIDLVRLGWDGDILI